jgi:phytoene dehydrogenase-like protein
MGEVLLERDNNYDAIIVGAGHNGLVCAAYLARSGFRVAIVERRPVLGGAAVTEELVPGFRFSTASLVNSLFRREIIQELELAKHGLEIMEREPSVISLYPDGGHVMLGRDEARNREEIARYSKDDAEAYPRYGRTMGRLAGSVEDLLVGPARAPLFDDIPALRAVLDRVDAIPDSDLGHLLHLLFGSARDVLDEWFVRDEIKALLAIDGVTGFRGGPSTPGSAYLMLYHMTGATETGRPAWGHVRGGMGGLTAALASVLHSHGAEVLTGRQVEHVLVGADGQARGVALSDGTELLGRCVVSAADPRTTFTKLVGAEHLPAGYGHAIAARDYEGVAAKVHLALDRLPRIRGFDGAGAGPQHRGTLLIAPTLDYLDRAYADAAAGTPSRSPHIECTIPTVLDPSLAPEGKHVMSIYVQYTPYTLSQGSWDDIKEAFADRVLECVEEYLPGITDSVLGRCVLSPLDLERRLGLAGGNLYHGAMSPLDLFAGRPGGVRRDYTSPVSGLYLCASGTRPGGGVCGVPGRNAAHLVADTLASASHH